MTTWHPLGNSPQDLIESRIQLHYAIQFVAAVAAALSDPLPDYSHTSLVWEPERELFIGELIRAQTTFRVGLDPISLTVVVLNPQHETIATLPLTGHTLTTGLASFKSILSNLCADVDRIEFLTYPPNDFPDHSLAHGATFGIQNELALSELTDYYANSHHLLQQMATITNASAVRIWPHHFDIATLLVLPGNQNGTPLTVGMGLSPGDASYNEPYWYVSPYPYPAIDALPPLAGNGTWHTQHWVGAVLPASRLTSSNASEQQQQVETFLQSAQAVAIALLQSSVSLPT